MHTTSTFLSALGALALYGPLAASAQGQSSTAKILIYSATEQFRHDSIPTAIEALKANQSSINVQFDATEDQSKFSDDNLAQYDALLFLSNTGEGVWYSS
jgi:hypothetical protein